MLSSRKKITASIVLYNQDLAELNLAIESVLSSSLVEMLYLLDNGSSQKNELYENPKINYIKNQKNIGFGAAHNLILTQIKDQSDFHLILNPDVDFNAEILETLVQELQEDNEAAMISPLAKYPTGELQITARKFPTIKYLFYRFVGFSNSYTKEMEYASRDFKSSFYIDFVQGSFMLFKTHELLTLKGFDTRFFLYMEDVDLCKRIQQSGKKIIYSPKVFFFHQYKRESSKKLRLFYHHIMSVIKYFNKW